MNKIISILNCDKNYGIGKRNGLLFKLPGDMGFFRLSTTGHVVAMGENTLLSFPRQKPLPNRKNIVLSNDPTHEYEGCVNVHDFPSFVALLKKESEDDTVFVIGGASIYNQTLPYVDEVWLNKVDADGQAEVFFNRIDENPDFELIRQGDPMNDNGYTTRLCVYRNKNKR
ncbi:MAG: dihydrofolate reductase [Bacilli bacterium]|nr:dihydrofolate reductase [Bacilli bacterium]